MARKTDRLRELTPAPGDLALLQAFVNTADLEAGTDRLASPRAVAEWLERHGLLAPRSELTAADFERVRATRETFHDRRKRDVEARRGC